MASNPLGIRGPDHFSWTVAEVEPVVDFYTRVFGAEVLYQVGPLKTTDLPAEADGRGWSAARLGVPDAHLKFVMLRLPGNIRIELFRFETPKSATQKPLSSSNIGASHIGLEVDDLEAAADHLRANGCAVFERIDSPPDSATAGISYRYFRDPWDNIFELCGRSSQQERAEGRNAIRRPINPDTMYECVSLGFSHAVEQRGGRTIHLAGQVAYDRDLNLVGEGDLLAQARQVLENLRQVLAAAGATPADVVRLRTYVVNHSPEKLGPVIGEIKAFYAGAVPAPNTFIGVQSLALPPLLIEIEADAALA